MANSQLLARHAGCCYGNVIGDVIGNMGIVDSFFFNSGFDWDVVVGSSFVCCWCLTYK